MHVATPRRAIFALCFTIAAAAGHAQQPADASQTPSSQTPSKAAASTAAPLEVTTTGGSQGTVPLFNTPSTVTSSVLYQSGGGIGIGRIPAATLDVGGVSIFRGILDLSRVADATKTGGTNSYPLRFSSQVYNSAYKGTLNPYFELQTEPTGNDTATPGLTLHLLYYTGAGPGPAETGFYLNSNGTVHFASGQTFPGASAVPGPVGPAGPQGKPGPAGPAGSLTLPNALSADGKGGYLLSLTDTGTKAGGGIFASGESGDVIDKGEVTYAGAGVTGKGGAAAYSAFAAGGAGIAGAGGTSSSAEESSGGIGVTGTGGAGTTSTAKGGTGGSFTGGSSANGAGNGVIAIGGDGVGAAHGGNGIYAQPGANGRYAGEFKGDIVVFGNIYKSGGSFKIDDPEDPANKFLSHSFVESPDMMNLYNGNVMTDANGDATIELPSWFEALNRDFRYQLTPIGQFAQAMVATEIANGRFTIKTDKPNVKVSWLVTGVRQDAWANAHRIPVEQEKTAAEKGHYLHPELYGHAGEPSLAEPAANPPKSTQP